MIYVVGFLFSNDRRWVTLIEKKRPDWQAGKLNGVGGKVEKGEAINDAMVREFREGTGVSTKWTDWEEFALLRGDHGAVYIFRALNTEHFFLAKTTTNEPIRQPLVKHLFDFDTPYQTIPNLPVLLRLALMPDVKYTTIEY